MTQSISRRGQVIIAVVSGLLILLLTVGYYRLDQRPSSPLYTGPVEKLSIGTAPLLSTLIWVAEYNGYFKEQGLDVTINLYEAGLFAFNSLLAGKVQVAACAQFVLSTKIQSGIEPVRGLATIGSSHNHKIIARKDRGISQPEDLAGKRIGVTLETTGQFFLDLFLTFHGLASDQVELVNLKPGEMADALARGQVDAVITWGPFAYNIAKQNEAQTVNWPAQAYQPYYWILVTTTRFIQAKPEVLTRMFRALAKAEDFVRQHPREAKEITARRLAEPLDYVEYFWPREEYVLQLDQLALMSMEEEARWAIRHNLATKKDIPNYLKYLYLAPLEAAKPGAVRLLDWVKKPKQ